MICELVCATGFSSEEFTVVEQLIFPNLRFPIALDVNPTWPTYDLLVDEAG